LLQIEDIIYSLQYETQIYKYREVTEEEKKLISIKYNLKRLNTIHNKEM